MREKGLKRMVMLLCILAMACGCTRKVYLPVERVERDTLYQARINVDTLLARDSIYFSQRGDTVVKEVYRWRMKSRVKVDTVYKTRIDTVPKIVKVEEKPSAVQSAMKSAKYFAGGMLTVIGVLALLYLLYRIKSFVSKRGL